MQDRYRAVRLLPLADLIPVDVVVSVCDQPGVLHRQEIEFRAEDLIVFREWIRHIEVLLIIPHSGVYKHMHLLPMIHDGARLPLGAVQCLRDAAVIVFGVIVGHVPVPGCEGEEVGADRRGLLKGECPDIERPRGRLLLELSHVRDRYPQTRSKRP